MCYYDTSRFVRPSYRIRDCFRDMSCATTDGLISSASEDIIDGVVLSNVRSIIIHEIRGSSNDITSQQSLANSLTQSLRLASSGSCVCRICHTNNSKEPLVSPCRCKGTLGYVHLSCLERWLNQSCRSHCELCRYHFNAVETPRYSRSESLRLWISDPRNRRRVQSDLLILTLLTIVTMGLVTVCILGMRYFVIEGRKIGVSKLWTRGSISFFLTIVVLGYATTVYLLAKDQVSPWYRWWKSTVNVRLVMERQEESRRSLVETRNNVSDEVTESFDSGENVINDVNQTTVTSLLRIDQVTRSIV